MKRIRLSVVLVALSAALVVACADDSGENNGSSVTYTILFSSHWSEENNGRVLPSGAHLTTMHGATHNDRYTAWRMGTLASVGIENVAERGNGAALREELAERKAAGVVDTIIQVGGLTPIASREETFRASRAHPLISVISMVAPTADWFVGVSGYSLLDATDDTWKADVSIDLRVYDAGTEQDTRLFSLGNEPENPQKLINSLVGNAMTGFQESQNQHIIGTLRFILQ